MVEKNVRDLSSRKILGMPVFSCKEGLNLGNIRQLLIDIKTFTIQGFLLGKRKVSQYERILPFSAVFNFGDDGVTVDTVSLLERRGQNNLYARALHHPPTIIGARVFTTGGRTLGKIEEYRFNSENGKISGLEIAPDGFFKVRTLIKGEYIIAISGNTAMLKEEATEDAISIDNSFITNMGNAAETVKEKAGEIMNNTADLTKRFSVSISERIEKIKKQEDEFINAESIFLDDEENRMDFETKISDDLLTETFSDDLLDMKENDIDDQITDVEKNQKSDK